MTTTYTWDFEGNVTIEKGDSIITLTPQEIAELCRDARSVAQYPSNDPPCAKGVIPVYTVNEFPTYIEVRDDSE